MVNRPTVEQGRMALEAIAVDPIMRYFSWDHLRPPYQDVSRPFGELAIWIQINVPRSAERTVALRKLLEAKDAAVRAIVGEMDA